MAATYNQGILSDYALVSGNEVINDISQFLVTMFVPETPLLTLLGSRPNGRQHVGSTTFNWLNSKTRPLTNTVGTGGMADGTGTSLPVADASMYMQGDVLQIESEYLEVTADPNLSVTPNTVTVKRGVAGSTGAAHTAGKTITILGNSRTGGEIDQTGIRNIRTEVSQYCQTFQFPVQVSGSAQATTNVVLPAGIPNLFTNDQIEALRNLKRSMENATYYMPGEAPSSTVTRPKMKGLKSLITTNNTTSPTNASSYAPSDFIRDTTQAIRNNGGEPSVCLCSTGAAAGFFKWGHNGERAVAGTTELGTPIEGFYVPFLPKILFLESQMLGGPTNITFVMLTIEEVFWRFKRPEFWNPRGNRGDAIEGEYIAEGAIQLENEAHHAWVEGVTGFST